MIYSVLIYETPGLADARSALEREQALQAHGQLQAETKASGAFVSAVQLAEAGATTVQHRGDETLVTDGPYAETKELFIGFYLFDCDNLDAVLRLAKRIPISALGRVEIRPAVWTESVGVTPQ